MLKLGSQGGGGGRGRSKQKKKKRERVEGGGRGEEPDAKKKTKMRLAPPLQSLFFFFFLHPPRPLAFWFIAFIAIRFNPSFRYMKTSYQYSVMHYILFTAYFMQRDTSAYV